MTRWFRIPSKYRSRPKGVVIPTTSTKPDPPSTSIWLGYAALIALLVTPLMLTSVPPLLDYPNHLARAHILATLDTDPLLQQYYAISYKPIPNLASDVFIPAAAKIFDIYVAGRLFLALCLITTMLGVACLHRVLHGDDLLLGRVQFR